MNNQTRNLWAKSEPYHPLWCHLLDAAAVARALKARFGPIEGLPEGWIEFLVGCHDIGKADRWFQNKDQYLANQLRDLGLHLPQWDSGADNLKKFRHEARSREWLQKSLKNRHGWQNRSENIVAKAVVGHHGDWSPDIYPERDCADTPLWESLRDELGAMLWETLQPEPCALERFPHASSAGVKLAAYVILSDWIASNNALFCYPNLPKNQSPAVYFAAACKRAAEVVAQMKLDAPEPQTDALKPTFGQVWPEIEVPRPLQEQLETRRGELAPGLAIIEAPMGEGKTEAAIYLAMLWQSGFASRGVYFALPTQATANAMHARYADFLQEWNPLRRARLMHGGAWLRDETPEALEFLPELQAENRELALQQARSARDWFRPMRRALLASEGVGTVDQALLCALRVKFGPLRLLGLSQKTLIIDEVHAYDEFMGVLLERLLQWCRALEVNVILLSATLSQAQKMALCRAYGGPNADLAALQNESAKIAPYPLLSFVPREEKPFCFAVEADAKRKRDLQIELKTGLLDDFAATARLCAQTIQNGGCACILANTVRAAQEIFRELAIMKQNRELPDDCELMLFHARFRTEERARIEADVVAKFGPDAGKKGKAERPKGAILVATQVVEQSLDVDFDFFFSQLAPIDLLLQRAGRLWRHERKWRPTSEATLTILTPPDGDWNFGASGKVYAPEILLRTLALCDGVTQWKLPADFRPLIERCYDRSEALGDFAARQGFGETLQKAESERDAETAAARNDAKIHCWIAPDAQSFEPVVRGADEADDEENGEQSKFFVAQTRRGDQSVVILALRRPIHFDLKARDVQNAELPRPAQRTPPRAELVEVFGQKAGVPRWWFNGVAPLDGFEAIEDGESFLRGHKLLPLRECDGVFQWQGRDAKGEFAIVDDPQLGLLRRALNAPESEATLKEADGGFNTP